MNFEMNEALWSAMVPFLIALLSWATTMLNGITRAKKEEIKARTKNETIKTYIDIVSTNAENVVNALNQTLVESLKSASEDGKLTKEEAHEIGKTAVNMLIDTLSDDVVNTLGTVFGDVHAYLGNVIETTVVKIKQKNAEKNAKG